MTQSLVSIGVVIGAVGFVALALFNRLVGKRNRVRNAFSGIDVQLKKRYELVPNLVETVKGYAAHERDVLAAVIRARAALRGQGLSPTEQIQKNGELAAGVSRLVALAEGYPDLKADQQFVFLMRSLNEIEEQLSAARRTYNASVNDYNDACEMFPSNLIASRFGFESRDFFGIDDSERVPVGVKLD